jgi:hypothetical protein
MYFDNSYKDGKYCLPLLQISLCLDNNNLLTTIISHNSGNYGIIKGCQNRISSHLLK